MDLFKILTIILFILVTIVTIKLHPEMHQPMIIEDADFKLTRISDTLLTKNIPVNATPAPVRKKEIKTEQIQTEQNTKFIQHENVPPKNIEKNVNIETPSNEPSQLQLLQEIIKKQENKKAEPKPKPEVQEPAPIQHQPKFSNPYMTEQEEIIAWNKWRSNLQNQIMKDSQIDYAPLGTMFLFTFIVDKYGNISNIKVECSNPNYMDIARDRVKPAISNLQRKPILKFPQGTQRTSTVVTGIFLIGTQERYSTPEDFSDFERVVY